MSEETQNVKQGLIKKHGRHASDTGSPEVQIGILTQQLDKLTKHFEKHPQDKHSKRGLFRAVTRRKKLLQYLKSEDVARYRNVLEAFGLRK